MRWMITSESVVAWKIAPSSWSALRRPPALTRFPLCAMAISPRAYSTITGWTLESWIRRRWSIGCVRSRRRRGAASRDLLVVEDFRDEPHPLVDVELAILLAGRDAGPLLSPVLQGEEAEVRQVGRVRMPVDAEDAALLVELVHVE